MINECTPTPCAWPYVSSQLFKTDVKSSTVLIAISTISLCTFTFTGQDQRPPPQITNFLKGNLLNRDEVKGGKEYNELNNDGFKLPCEATGQNLKWTWQHNGTNIFTGFRSKYKVQGDGSLIGESLLPDQSGNYQCFVEDTVTGKRTFSRKVQVLVTCKSLHFTFLLCSSRKIISILPLTEGIGISWGVGGLWKARRFKEMYEA